MNKKVVCGRKHIRLISRISIVTMMAFSTVSFMNSNSLFNGTNVAEAAEVNDNSIDSWMPDKNVQSIVMEELNISDAKNITKADMLKLTSFEASSVDFTSFEGLQYATNLKTLSLSHCSLPDGFQVSFFAKFASQLTTLILTNCGLTANNVQGYITFPNLESLDISNNNLEGTLDDTTYFSMAPAIDVHNSTITVGSNWTAKDNFDSATDTDGNAISFDNITVSGNVDVKTPGDYVVEYTYPLKGTWNNESWARAIVHVENPTPTPAPVTKGKVNVKYVDTDGNTISDTVTLTGNVGDSYTTAQKTIAGYTFKEVQGNVTGTYSSNDMTVTYVYSKDSNLVNKGTAVYGVNHIYLYKNATFKKSDRLVSYANKARIDRPMFVVIGYSKSARGIARYRVKDVNHESKSVGKTGYITARNQYVNPVYYAGYHKTITVINEKGINAYKQKSLVKKTAHYKQGQVLRVKKVVKHNLTTRFVLTNGKYISANKKLVASGKYRMPSKVKAKTAINRYDDANLTKRNHHFSKRTHQVFKVLGWAYSNTNDFSRNSSLRYRVAGGYITANSTFVNSK